MGREDFSQSSQLTTLVGKPTNRYKRLPKNVGTIKSLTQARAKPNNRLHYSAYPLIQKEYSATYTQLTNLDFYSPIITILGSNPVSHLVDTPYVDVGVKVDQGSELYSTMSTVDTSQFGTYSVVYKARDGINADTTVARVVKVGMPPDVTINGQNPFTLEKFDVYTDAGITINDSNSALVFTTSTVNNIEVGTYTVNYSVSNPAYAEVFSRTVRVDDTVPPVITITGGTPYELERFDPYVDEGATVDVGSELTNTDLSNVQNTAIGSFDVVYTAYDGNTTVTNTRTVNVVDTVPPVITITNNTLQGNTLERFDSYVDGGATVDLGSELTNTSLSNVQNTTPGTFDVVYTAYDGNTTVTATRTVTVVDTKLPELTLIGDTSPYNIQPGIVFANIDPGFSNDAGTVVTVDYSNASIIQNTSFDVVYRGNDGVHPEIVLIRRVSVDDTLSPIVTINGDQVVTIERYSEYVDAGVTLDPGSSLVSGYPVSTVDNTATGSYTVTYLATDSINPDTTNVRTVHVVDTTPPIVLLNGADPLTMERFAVFSDIDPGVTYQAPHTGTLTSVDISQLDNTAIGGGTVTYNVVDDQNLSNTISRAVTVVDTTPPVATLNNASTNYTLERYGDWSVIDPGVTVDEGSFVTQINIDNTTVGLNRPVDYVISDGNTLHDITVTRNITIEDTVLPYAELIGSNSMRIPLNSVWEDVDPGLTNFDTGSSLSSMTGFDNTVASAQTVSYNLTDGVNSNIIYRDVTFTLPSGTVNPLISSTLERFGSYTEPVGVITNITDGYVARIDTSNVDSTVAHGTQQVIVYDLGDDINNTLVTRTITVQDTVPPYAELIGSNNIRVPLNSVWEDVDPGIQNLDAGSSLVSVTGFSNTVTDAQFVYYNLTDNVNSSNILRVVTCTTPDGEVNTAVSTTLERFSTYVEPDEAIINIEDGYVARIDTGNVDSTTAHGTQQVIVYDLGDNINNTLVTRTITIQDTVAPVITITNDTPAGNTLERFDEYVDEGATVDQGSQLTSTDLSQVQNTAIGSFNVVYTATDGINPDTTAIRTVNVVDTVPPVITITNDTSIGNTLEQFDVYSDEGATVDLGSQLTNTDLSAVQNTAVGTFDVVYTATDGNTTVTATRTVSVVDTTPPVITLIGSNPYIVATDTTYVDPNATADTGETVTADTSQINMSVEGDYTVTYSATDAYNNTGTATRTVTVKDREFIQQAMFTSYITSGYGGSGTSVSLDFFGNTAIVGREGGTSVGNPAVVIYTRSGSTWSGSASGGAYNLSPPSGVSVTSFGHAVDISGNGNYAIVSDVNSTNAYIYTWSGSTWSHQQNVSNVNVVTSDRFGDDVAINYDGNTVVVGASRYDRTGGGSDHGAAFIFTRSGTTWSQQAKLTGVTNVNGNGYFGETVDISNDGNTVIVGAWKSWYFVKESVYIFTRSGTTWSQQQRISPTPGWSGDMFGSDVSISGDGNTALISAYKSRLVYVWTRSGTTWSQQAYLNSSWSVQTNNDWNGYDTSISYDGDTVIVSAHRYAGAATSSSSSNTVGAIFIFRRSGTTWTETQKIMNPEEGNLYNMYGAHHDYFGESVAMSAMGDVVIMSNVNNAVYMFNYELPP